MLDMTRHGYNYRIGLTCLLCASTFPANMSNEGRSHNKSDLDSRASLQQVGENDTGAYLAKTPMGPPNKNAQKRKFSILLG